MRLQKLFAGGWAEEPVAWSSDKSKNEDVLNAEPVQQGQHRTAFHVASVQDLATRSRRGSEFLSHVQAEVPLAGRITRDEAAHFLARPTAYNFTVEEAAHAAHHSNEEQMAIKKALAKDHSITAEEAKFFSLISGPLTFLTSMFAVTAAYLEVQNGWMLSQKAKMMKEEFR
eukprot:symbB.v1.2.004961.t1/scaffold284.1/size240047/1